MNALPKNLKLEGFLGAGLAAARWELKTQNSKLKTFASAMDALWIPAHE